MGSFTYVLPLKKVVFEIREADLSCMAELGGAPVCSGDDGKGEDDSEGC
jgi:hypothetical protein